MVSRKADRTPGRPWLHESSYYKTFIKIDYRKKFYFIVVLLNGKQDKSKIARESLSKHPYHDISENAFLCRLR